MKRVSGTGVPKIKYDRFAILNFIVDYKQTHDGNSPTMREIMREMGISSTSVVDSALRNLAKRGMIRTYPERGRGRGIARRIEVVGGKWRWARMPVEAGR